VFDTATGNWYIRTTSGGVLAMGVNWGYPGCVPVAGDFDTDGADDLAVYHAATGRWHVRTLSGAVLAADVNWGWAAASAVRP